MQTNVSTNTRYKTDKYIVRPYISFFVTVSSIYTIFNPAFYEVYSCIIGSYMVYGLFVDSWDYCIHHLLVLLFIGFNNICLYYKPQLHENYLNIRQTTIKTEYSTLFYLLKIISSDILYRVGYRQYINVAKSIFNVVFFVSFIKVRILNLCGSCFNPDTYNWLISVFDNSNTPYFIFQTCIIGFTSLNIYWLFHIIRKAALPYLQDTTLHLTCEYWCRFTVMVSVLAVFYVYYSYSYYDIPAFLDVHGLILMVYGSFVFHNRLYKQILHSNHCVSDKHEYSCSQSLIIDTTTIQFSTFSTLVSCMYSYLPYTITIFALVCVGVITVMCNWLARQYIQSITTSGDNIQFSKDTTERFKLYMLINAPNVIGAVFVLSVSYCFHPYEIWIMWCNKQIIMIVSTVMAMYVQPFGNLNHIFIHFVFAYCHYLIALQIVENNAI